jgi:hypothetical protein
MHAKGLRHMTDGLLLFLYNYKNHSGRSRRSFEIKIIIYQLLIKYARLSMGHLSGFLVYKTK